LKGKTDRSNKKYYLGNRDLLIIAVLSGIGGVMSTYVGYLGNLLNRIFAVPFGAGQFVAGLHVFWIILAAGLIRRPGAASAAGLLKGIIELLTGSSHGIAIVLVSLVQGLLVDLVLLICRRHTLISYMLAAGIGAASNVFVFQLIYFSGAPLTYILFISLLAFLSGILLGGSFGHSVIEIVQQARPFRFSGKSGTERVKPQLSRFKLAVTGCLVLILAAGASYYYGAVFEPPWVGPQCRVEGDVEKTFSFQLSHFAEHETTITAELVGEVTRIPPQNYTGIPLHIILKEAGPLAEAQTLVVTATDGYTVEFALQEVMKDELMVLIHEAEMLRLIAGNYPGGHWVKMVNRLIVK
jgi:ABC-type thiamin/hydroxymethylpyrimidine transport system permease subunit